MKNRVLVLFVVLSLFFTACSSSSNAETSATAETVPTVPGDDTIIAEGRVEPISYADIAFNASGSISEVLVKEGESVKKGQPLIRMGDESDTHYAAAQLELANAQKAWDDLANSRDAEFAQTVIDLRDAQENFDEANDYLKYLQTSQKVPQTEARAYLKNKRNSWQYVYRTKTFKGPAPEDWLIEAGNDLALKKAELGDVQRAYDRLKDGPDTDQLPLLEARLNAAKAGVAAFEVTAPFDGVVTQLNTKLGSTISAGQIAVTIADMSSWTVVTTDVTEMDVVKLQEGQHVVVTLDAIPNVELKGEVLSIGQNYGQNQGDIVYEVTVMLTDVDPAMRWGMTAAVKFE
jgi:multidrug resistance efflux pump